MENNYYLSSFKKNTQSDIAIFKQIYLYLRNGILNSNLPLGYQLPSSRALATQFHVSRNSILMALDILLSEDLIITKAGSGTYVSTSLPIIKTKQSKQPIAPSVYFTPRTRSHTGIFALGKPDIKQFPQKLWAKAMKDGITDALNYSHKTGNTNFKYAIVEYVKKFRGIDCTIDNIVPLTSGQAGFDLVLRTLIKSNSTILLEDPCYPAIASAVDSNKHKPIYIPADCDNFNNSPSGQLAYVTPSSQYPMAHTMTTNKRLSLISWALNNNAWVLEDDIDSEFYYEQTLPPALYSMNDSNVLYLGTFSKTISPAVKVAYIIAPVHIAKKLNIACGVTGQEPSIFMQSAIANMFRDKKYYLHIRKMKNIYVERQQQIKQSIYTHMPFAHLPKNNSVGLQIPVYLPKKIKDNDLMHALSKQGFSCKALSEYCHKTSLNGLHLGYGHIDEKYIDNHIEKISKSCMMFL